AGGGGATACAAAGTATIRTACASTCATSTAAPFAVAQGATHRAGYAAGSRRGHARYRGDRPNGHAHHRAGEALHGRRADKEAGQVGHHAVEQHEGHAHHHEFGVGRRVDLPGYGIEDPAAADSRLSRGRGRVVGVHRVEQHEGQRPELHGNEVLQPLDGQLPEGGHHRQAHGYRPADVEKPKHELPDEEHDFANQHHGGAGEQPRHQPGKGERAERFRDAGHQVAGPRHHVADAERVIGRRRRNRGGRGQALQRFGGRSSPGLGGKQAGKAADAGAQHVE
nr:hypothetical protein [Tanacetum cinerariifolium]